VISTSSEDYSYETNEVYEIDLCFHIDKYVKGRLKVGNEFLIYNNTQLLGNGVVLNIHNEELNYWSTEHESTNLNSSLKSLSTGRLRNLSNKIIDQFKKEEKIKRKLKVETQNGHVNICGRIDASNSFINLSFVEDFMISYCSNHKSKFRYLKNETRSQLEFVFWNDNTFFTGIIEIRV
jgi:hypothetical protein